MDIVKFFSVQYDAFLNELVRLFPYKIEIRLLTSYVATFTPEYLLEEGSKLLNEHVELAISNRDFKGSFASFQITTNQPSGRSPTN